MSKPVCIIWVNEAKVFEQALAQSGLSDRFEVHSFAPNETIPDDIAVRTEALMGWRPGNALKRMPKLRWLQAMTAGVEMWIDHPDLRADTALC